MRDIADQLPDDVVILGMSADAPDRQQTFDQRHSLGYQLLSDADNSTMDAYGARRGSQLYGNSSMGTIRSAFLIDAEGRIKKSWYGITPKKTAQKLLATARQAR